MYVDFENKDEIVKQVRGLQLSLTKVVRRIEELGCDIRNQLIADLSAAPYALALHRVKAQICVMLHSYVYGSTIFDKNF